MIEAYLFIIRTLVGSQSETILGFPFAIRAVVTSHKSQVCPIRVNPISALALPLLIPFINQQRLKEQIAESDVYQPTLVDCDHQRHMIEIQSEFPFRVSHSGRKHLDIVS